MPGRFPLTPVALVDDPFCTDAFCDDSGGWNTGIFAVPCVGVGEYLDAGTLLAINGVLQSLDPGEFALINWAGAGGLCSGSTWEVSVAQTMWTWASRSTYNSGGWTSEPVFSRVFANVSGLRIVRRGSNDGFSTRSRFASLPEPPQTLFPLGPWEFGPGFTMMQECSNAFPSANPGGYPCFFAVGEQPPSAGPGYNPPILTIDYALRTA
jgi:hypothetical protein